ncbi:MULTISPECIES: DUF1289 domain-containing protein [Aliagarivorans]|uniref:DUF1289 domain-containing protein n=1 Tax=Aliagarivorans TaxID=882379 RepID=UPI00047A6B44|nr:MULTISPECIES: DUF1289 domain-containing protein [Aliagarivorans]
MEQLEFFAIPNPCRGICQSNNRGLCLGCFRTRDERFHWQNLSIVQQQNILRLTKQRKLRFIRQQRAALAAQQNSIIAEQVALPFDAEELD